jgi:hypothetical protein
MDKARVGALQIFAEVGLQKGSYEPGFNDTTAGGIRGYLLRISQAV